MTQPRTRFECKVHGCTAKPHEYRLRRTRERAARIVRKPYCSQHQAAETFANTLDRRYGISVEQYEAMLIEQCGKCDICDVEMGPGINPNVDHCHETGAVRGLLCNQCNQGLGYAKDSIEILQNMQRYLIKTETDKSTEGKTL